MAAYVENERLHNIEMEAILELIQALKPDEARFDELVAKGKDLTFTRTAVEETFYKSCVARMAVVETRVAAENASWKARVAEFEAGKASSGTPFPPATPNPLPPAIPIPPAGTPSTLGVAERPADEDGVELFLSSTTPADWHKNRQMSCGPRRLFSPLLRGMFVGPDGKLNADGMRSYLRNAARSAKFDSMFTDGVDFQIKLDAPLTTGNDTAVLIQLVDCPFFQVKKRYMMWVLATELEDSDTSVFDFMVVSRAEEYENILVIRQAVEALVVWLRFTFGEQMMEWLGRDLLKLVYNGQLADAARDHLLYIPMVITRILASLWGVLRSTIENEHRVRENLSNGAFVGRWRLLAEGVLKVTHAKIDRFASKFEKPYKAQLSKSLAASRKASGDDDSSSGSEQPKAKKARSSSSTSSLVVTKTKQQPKAATASSTASGQRKGICFGALAEYVSFTGPVDDCKKGAACAFSHDFSAFKLDKVKTCIKKSGLITMRSAQVKADFTAAVESSGKF